MECVTTENSDLKAKSENTGNAETIPSEPKIEDPVNMMEVVKQEEEEKTKENLEQSDHESQGWDEDVENILGVLGKYLYRQRRRKAKNRKRPITKRNRKLSLRNRASAKRAGQGSYDGICQTSNRNWNRISIYPFINFMRDFRKRVPKECPPDTMALQASKMWTQMRSEEKLPFIRKAERAKQNGYME